MLLQSTYDDSLQELIASPQLLQLHLTYDRLLCIPATAHAHDHFFLGFLAAAASGASSSLPFALLLAAADCFGRATAPAFSAAEPSPASPAPSFNAFAAASNRLHHRVRRKLVPGPGRPGRPGRRGGGVRWLWRCSSLGGRPLSSFDHTLERIDRSVLEEAFLNQRPQHLHGTSAFHNRVP